jgi:hypothetical protein
MKAYLEAKREALKAYTHQQWSLSREAFESTNWPLTIAHFLKWAVTRLFIGGIMGVGAWQAMTTVYFMAVLDQGIPVAAGPIDVETAQRVVEGFITSNVVFAVFGASIFAALTVGRLRRYRIDGKEPVVFAVEPTDKEYETISKVVRERNRQRRISY